MPTTSPSTTPIVTALDAAARSAEVLTGTPTLTNANNGRMNRFVHGVIASAMRCSTGRPEWSWTGVSRPITTAAIVACTPDRYVQNHATLPTTTYTDTGRTPMRRSTTSATSAASEPSNHNGARSFV